VRFPVLCPEEEAEEAEEAEEEEAAPASACIGSYLGFLSHPTPIAFHVPPRKTHEEVKVAEDWGPSPPVASLPVLWLVGSGSETSDDDGLK
jgi:hypothetical protein